MNAGDDGFAYETVPEYEAEPDTGPSAADDDIALLVQSMMKPQAAASAEAKGMRGAAAAAGGGGQLPQQQRAHLDTLPTVADDYIRNFLIRCNMRRALEAFNTEWYELKAKGALPDDDVLHVPDIYAQNERLGDAVSRLRVELGHAQEVASKAQQQWERLRRERDFHRMHHKRVVQEKNKLITDMKRVKTHFESYEPTMRELRGKYESAMREKMLLKVERDKLAARSSSLETQLGAMDEAAPAAGGGGRAVASAATSGVSRAGGERGAVLGATAAAGDGARGARGVGGARSPARRAGSKALAAAGATALGSAPLPAELPNPFLALAFEPAHAGAYSSAGTIHAHGAAISGVAFHPSKPVVATASDDTTWRLWSMPEGELIMTGEGHRAWLSDVEFHPYGSHLATASGDGIIKVWDLTTASCALTLADHTQTVWGVAWHATGDFLLSAGMDHTVRLFDVAGGGGRVRQTLRGHVDSVNAVVWQPYSAAAATASGDKTVSLWDTRTALCVQTFYGHTNAVADVAFNLRGDTLASCDADGCVRVWDVRMVAERASLVVSRGAAVHAVALDRSGACLAAACDDGSVRVVDCAGAVAAVLAGGPAAAGAALLRPVASLKGHAEAVQALAFDPTSSFLVSAGNDASLRIWSEGGAAPNPRRGGGGSGGS